MQEIPEMDDFQNVRVTSLPKDTSL